MITPAPRRNFFGSKIKPSTTKPKSISCRFCGTKLKIKKAINNMHPECLNIKLDLEREHPEILDFTDNPKPYNYLIVNIVSLAIDDLKAKSKKLRTEAENYIFNSCRHDDLSFNSICLHFNINPDFARKRIKLNLNKGENNDKT